MKGQGPDGGVKGVKGVKGRARSQVKPQTAPPHETPARPNPCNCRQVQAGPQFQAGQDWASIHCAPLLRLPCPPLAGFPFCQVCGLRGFTPSPGVCGLRGFTPSPLHPGFAGCGASPLHPGFAGCGASPLHSRFAGCGASPLHSGVAGCRASPLHRGIAGCRASPLHSGLRAGLHPFTRNTPQKPLLEP